MKKKGSICDYRCMKNVNNYYTSLENVDSVLEIRLCSKTWAKVKRIAEARNKSYSWVVRYTLFRLIKRKNLNEYIISTQSSNVPDSNDSKSILNDCNKGLRKRLQGGKEKHRHRLCLYGEDELYIRLCSVRLRCTMSHLVRLGIDRYLDALIISITRSGKEKLGQFSKAAWYWLGIKAHYDVDFHTINISKLHLNFKPFDKSEYW